MKIDENVIRNIVSEVLSNRKLRNEIFGLGKKKDVNRSRINKRVTCKDGFSMSVQANSGAYCEPRIDNAKAYTHVEVGSLSDSEPLLEPYEEDYTNDAGPSVFAYVPVQIIAQVIANHGGMISGEVPPGVPKK